MSGMFLDEGIKNAEDQRAKEAAETAKKRAAGYVKVRALDPRTNKMINTWVEKDAPTKAFEAERKKKEAMEKKESDLAARAKKLEMLKVEKELKERAVELDALEKELLGEETKGKDKK